MPSPRRPLARLRALDTRLAAGELPRSLAVLLVGLLVIQGAVVLDRTAGDAPAPAVDPAPVALPGPGTAAPSPTASPTTTTAPSAAVGSAAPAAPRAAGPEDAATAPAAGLVPPDPDPSASTPGPTPAPTQDAASAPRSTTTAQQAPPRAPQDPARARFEQRFPAHAAADQDAAVPASSRWAVLIGVNEHQGRTRDNVASRQDAEDLAAHLVSLGWREDHVLVLTDLAATRENIVQALRWLARNTTPDSVVVVHYSGHTKQWPGRDVDGDGEVTDEGLWPSDNRFVTDRELAELLGDVRAARMWVNVAACEAAGLADPGLVRPGRVLTFSSREDEKSYEDPERGNSVWGYFVIEEALRGGFGDRDGDRVVTVEEAFAFAAPRAVTRTERQSRGAQHPVMIDRLDGAFDLRVPAPPRPRPEPSPSERCSFVVCPPDRRS